MSTRTRNALRKVAFVALLLALSSVIQTPLVAPFKLSARRAPIALVASTSAVSSDGGDSVTTGAINTTGANLVVVFISDYTAESRPTASLYPADSKSCTWTNLTTRSSSVTSRGQLSYCLNGTVGSGHTFSATTPVTGPTYPSIYVAAFSGVSAFDQESGATSGGGSGTSQAPGSLTPPSDGSLFITGLSYDLASTLSVDGSFTITHQQPLGGGQNIGGGLAYFIQTTAGAKNPAWSWTGAASSAAAMATFTAIDTGGGGGVTPCARPGSALLLGVGCEAR